MKVKESKYVTSTTGIKEAPVFNLPEIIMIGRSNVGKSSLINTLCNKKNMAQISKKPGKTKLINYFMVNEDLILTDLPGYGFANRSKEEQERWRKRIEEYLLQRKEIVSGIQLIDSRHEIQKNDIQMRQWLEYYKINTFVVLTKTDYLSRNQAINAVNKLQKELNTNVFGFSAKTGEGKDQILKHISALTKK